MIHLDRADVPAELDADKVQELTDQFATDQSSVWNTAFIRKPLLDSSHGKCAYCETKVDEESKYMEVDHWRCKRDFAELVVQWSNLVPACKRCNGQKSAWNVEIDGCMINPFDLHPRDHLYMTNYRLRGRDQIGMNTIEALYLNDSDRLVSVRFGIGEAVHNAIEKIRSDLVEYVSDTSSTRRRNKVMRGMEKLFIEASAPSEFCATTATVLLSDPDYGWIRENLVKLNLWDEFGNSEIKARDCSLQK